MQGIAEAAHCPRVWVASQTTFRAVQHGEKGGICRWRFKGTSIAASPCGRMLLTCPRLTSSRELCPAHAHSRICCIHCLFAFCTPQCDRSPDEHEIGLLLCVLWLSLDLLWRSLRLTTRRSRPFRCAQSRWLSNVTGSKSDRAGTTPQLRCLVGVKLMTWARHFWDPTCNFLGP